MPPAGERTTRRKREEDGEKKESRQNEREKREGSGNGVLNFSTPPSPLLTTPLGLSALSF
ncbi:hypothetical protein OUZ56_002626 [Daphnia magna]|uniref:Uncharacterized protein n=1 Tax=Daphnia magna TaxID=35525 RepID=A0ABR0A6C8_9CRUS|nr:hypothetical protein OUZ56_002626 [Daphnia magna]